MVKKILMSNKDLTKDKMIRNDINKKIYSLYI